MKHVIALIVAVTGLRLYAAPVLPLSFDLGVHPDVNGTRTDARLEWRWSDRLASRAEFSFESSATSGELSGYGDGALYTVASSDGSIVLKPLALNGRLAFLEYDAGTGLGLKTESYRERGTYQNVGTQTFDNQVGSWRLGVQISGSLSGRFGPAAVSWELATWPFALYVLSQHQSSSLIAPEGSLS